MSEKATKAKVTKTTPAKVTAIVMREVALTPRQTNIVQAVTPTAFIKTKPGRGGKKVTFIEGGYVISVLNQAFSPLGWEFKIAERGETQRQNEKSAEGEVWVYGELTIIDHKNGFRTTKGQYGQHPIHKNVPIGDAYKAAGTDALKKCASMLGIAMDVYWGQLDAPESAPPKEPTTEEYFERAKMMISASKNIGGLIEYDDRLKDGKKFNEAQKKELHGLITKRVSELEGDIK